MKLLTLVSCLLFVFLDESEAVAKSDSKVSDNRIGVPCASRVIDSKRDKMVCVCNATYCDNLVFNWPTKSGSGLLIQSTKAGLRFGMHSLDANLAELGEEDFTKSSLQRDEVVEFSVDLSKEYQTILGFGGAFTDASGLNIQSLPDDVKRYLMESYFGEHGSQYNFGRVVIAGADCSTRAYSYDDLPRGSSDFNLTYWSLAPEDHEYKIPLIKEANQIVAKYGSTLRLFGSSWSPPAFMKTSQSLVRGHLIDSDQVYRSYAQYLVNFYSAYKKNGITFWGGTVQNEPKTSDLPTYNFNSLQLGAEQAAKFVGKYLGPALVANGYTKDKFKLMVNDDNTDTLERQASAILADKDARKYIAGLAFHWYNHDHVPYSVLSECHDRLKNHIEFMLMTEACIEPGKVGKPVDLGSWERGVKYAKDIIEDLRHHSGGWVDWNLALDQRGGPNWVSNFLDSPVIVNKDKAEFYKQPMFYILAHFSRFFRPDSVRVDLSEKAKSDHQLLAVAVHKKDTGHVVVNVLNNSKHEKVFAISVLGLSKDVKVKGMSMNTVVLKL